MMHFFSIQLNGEFLRDNLQNKLDHMRTLLLNRMSFLAIRVNIGMLNAITRLMSNKNQASAFFNGNYVFCDFSTLLLVSQIQLT